MPGKRNVLKNSKSTKRGAPPTGNFRLLVQVPSLRVRLPYSYQGSLVEGAAALGAAYTFRISDVFDPDFSGGGLQPLGFDQYTQMYGRYHVHGFRYEVSFATRTNVPIFVGTYLSAQSTLPASAVAWFVVNETVKTRQLGSNSGGDNTAVLRGSTNIASVFGVTPQEYKSDQDFSALVTADPARNAYLHVFVVGRSAVATMDFSIRCYYDTEFSQPVALSMS